jgi:hypothetical protein
MTHVSSHTGTQISARLFGSHWAFPWNNLDSTTLCPAPYRHSSNLQHLIDSSHTRPKIESWLQWDYGDIKTTFPRKSFLCSIKKREYLRAREVTVLRINFGDKRRRIVKFKALRVRRRGQNSRYPTDRRLVVVRPSRESNTCHPFRSLVIIMDKPFNLIEKESKADLIPAIFRFYSSLSINKTKTLLTV